MSIIDFRFTSFVMVGLTLFVASGPLRAQPEPIKQLGGKNYREAVDARDSASRTRARIEAELWDAKVKDGIEPKAARAKNGAEIEALIKTYQEIMSRYPHTEIAANCALSLSGFYQFLGDADKALEVATKTAEEFAGTHLEVMLVFEVGLSHLQVRRDPAEAIKWFARILHPGNPPGAKYGVEDKFYNAAQRQLFKCELQLGQTEQAKARKDALKKAYPQYADGIEQDFQQLVANIGPRPRADRAVVPLKEGPLAAKKKTAQSAPLDLAGLVSRLDRVRVGAEEDAVTAELTKHGDKVVAEIRRQIVEELLHSAGGQHRAVDILQKINSEMSRDLLRQMALQKIEVFSVNTAGWAAQALVKIDPNQVNALLVSTTPEVLYPTMNALKAKTLEAEQVERVKVCLTNESVHIRWCAADVLVKGAKGPLAVVAIHAIGQALTATADHPMANEIYPDSVGATHLEMSASPYIQSLSSAGVDEKDLSELAKKLRGPARDAVVLAQGLRGNRSVHDEVVKLAKDSQVATFRARAAQALETIGTADDLPLLRNLADNDPAKEVRPFSLAGKNKVEFPVREAAKQSIRSLEAKSLNNN